MKILSQGLISDLIFHRFSGLVIDRVDYIVVHTPDNHDYFWGNFLIFPCSPQKDDIDRWLSTFEHELGRLSGIHHQAFTWDRAGADSDLLQFEKLGFTAENSTVLTGNDFVLDEKRNNTVSIRQVETNRDWAQVLDLQIASSQSSFDRDLYKSYMIKKFEQYRLMVENGIGAWFAAFDGQTLVGDLGIFFDGKTGRFQNVETHLDHRRHGICRTLVYEVSKWALMKNPEQILVVEADIQGDAGRIYSSIGYKETEQRTSLCRHNSDRWSSLKS